MPEGNGNRPTVPGDVIESFAARRHQNDGSAWTDSELAVHEQVSADVRYGIDFDPDIYSGERLPKNMEKSRKLAEGYMKGLHRRDIVD